MAQQSDFFQCNILYSGATFPFKLKVSIRTSFSYTLHPPQFVKSPLSFIKPLLGPNLYYLLFCYSNKALAGLRSFHFEASLQRNLSLTHKPSMASRYLYNKALGNYPSLSQLFLPVSRATSCLWPDHAPCSVSLCLTGLLSRSQQLPPAALCTVNPFPGILPGRFQLIF